MWKAVSLEDWMENRVSELSSVRPVVEEIIARVGSGGDRALLELTRRYDGVDAESILVGEEEVEAAYHAVSDKVIANLIEADARISRFHELQKPKELWLEEVEPGVVLGVRNTPLDRIGAYIPVGELHTPQLL